MAKGEKRDWKAIIVSAAALLVPTGFAVTAAGFVYNNYLITPVMQYNDETCEFTVQADFRGISMRVYPQMVIRFDDTVVLVTHLDGYLKEETIHFSERKAQIEKDHQEYCDTLLGYVQQGVLEQIEAEYGREAADEISTGLNVSVSFIGGVQYQAPLGRTINTYCIIETNGLLTDHFGNLEQVEHRLYENEIELGDDPGTVSRNPEVTEIVRVAATEIGQLYGDDHQSI